MTSTGDKIKAFRKKLEKKYSDSTELFPDFGVIKEIESVPSPSAIINAVTGIGGFPKGRVTEIYGPFSSGKTTIATEVVAAVQANNPDAVALYLDYEHAWDARYARTLGTDLTSERLIFAQPEYFEQGAQIAIECIEQDLVDVIVIDSAAAMTPKSEMEGDFDKSGGSQKGTQAALMAQFLTKITKLINKGRKPAVVIINQTRAKIAIGGARSGPRRDQAAKEQSAAGNALKFYCSLRLELEIVDYEGESERGSKGTDQIYTQNRIRVTSVKNKVAPPFMRGQFVIEYGKGINNIASIAELAEAKLGIMSGAGFFKYEGATPETSFSCRGREAFQELLVENPDLRVEIETAVLKVIRDEHAKSLGQKEIIISGKAKELTAGNSITLNSTNEDFESTDKMNFED